jgi:hypothetical protein
MAQFGQRPIASLKAYLKRPFAMQQINDVD